MKKQAKITRTVFDKSKFNDTITTVFTQLVDEPDLSTFDVNLASQEDFWILYDKFFYQIPKNGDTQSHTYLIQTSADYANYDAQQEEISALLEEIAELRKDNLELRQQLTANISDISTDNKPLTIENNI